MLKEKLDSLAKKFGPPEKAEKFDPAVAARLQERVPAGLIDFLREYGIGIWLKGRFQFCSCTEYDAICHEVLDGDSQFTPEESAIFGFTAFGKVYMWNHRHKIVLKVNLARMVASADSLNKTLRDPELDISANLTFIDKDHTDMFADTPSAPPMFAATLKRLGELDLGEVYGFVPALAIGGSAGITSVKKMKAREHLLMLAELDRARLMNYNDGRERFIRTLGS